MRKVIKKCLGTLLTAGMLLSSMSTGGLSANAASTQSLANISNTVSTKTEGESTTDSDTESKVTTQQTYDLLTADELTEDMGAGWNLGNTMDGHTGLTPCETAWQNVKTTKKLIKSVHDLGFNTVRIPVTWGTMIDDDNGYSINETWISRVQDIVDYCISQDMYVIINIHHDGAEQTGWLRIATDDYDSLAAKFEGVWRSISTYFKDYDEHLIFESMNEVKGTNMTTLEENQVIMKLNQIFVDTVRATGSNNAQRWLMVPGKYNYIDSICNTANGFELPTDTVSNRLILSVHIYTPWSFCGSESVSTENDYTYSIKRLASNDSEVKPLYDTYTSKGIPVVIGEYGCVNKDNSSERSFYLEGMNRIFKKYKCIGVYWDQGWYDRTQTPDYSFAIVDRSTGKTIDKTVTDGLMRGTMGLAGNTDYTTLEKNTVTKVITSLTASKTTADLTVGDSTTITMTYKPAKSTDVILWKTADPTIATVYNGKIHAKGIGTTTVTAFSMGGSKSVKITVNVTAAAAVTPATEIVTANDSYDLSVDDTARINATLVPANTDETVYYRSSDDSVATVSTLGKIVATGKGAATIQVCTSGGLTKDISVHVTAKAISQDIQLALNLYYNDTVHEYYANEIGSDIATISADGQYELTFDCSTDLSSNAKASGITSINRASAIYLKDYSVSTGSSSISPFSACQITYDKIVVDGTELTITNSDSKSAIKDSGIFDTNDPINAYDGSVVQEVSNSNSSILFNNMDNPQKITVTFTLSGIEYRTEEGADSSDSSDDTDPSNDTDTSTTDTDVKGTTFTSNGAKYIITKTATSGTGKVTYVAPTNKTKTTSVIPTTVKSSEKTYKITAISAGAFKNCTKLKTLTIKSKTITSIGKNAIKNINKKAVIKVPSAKLSAYKKLFTAKTGYKKTMTIKK